MTVAAWLILAALVLILALGAWDAHRGGNRSRKEGDE